MNRRSPPGPPALPAEASAPLDEGTTLPPVLKVEELADLLRINRKTAYAAIEDGEIPGVQKLGRVIRVHRDTVLEWLAGRRCVSRS